MQRARTTTPAGQRECQIDIPEPFCLIVFGASGDLTKRKIIPAVYRLFATGLLPERFFIAGAARSELSDAEFRRQMRGSVQEAYPDVFNAESWAEFEPRLHYIAIDYSDPASYKALAQRLAPLEKAHATGGNRVVYLAVPPTVYEEAVTSLGLAGFAVNERGYTHLVIEKPFGRDLESARRLNTAIRAHFAERQVYRMDHYLAKETVQNILTFRFANSIFEPLWDRRYIDHVQITVAESIGVEHRAGYYESAGVIRDMFQNHIMQLVALTAMEPPSRFDADRVRDEKTQVFRSIRPMSENDIDTHVVLGQYAEGLVDGQKVAGYRGESDVNPQSATPTYCAMKIFIDNWRWNGVPFYLRSGKRLAKRKAEISIHFKPVPHMMFPQSIRDAAIEPNVLALRIQPEEGIKLTFQTKQPGSKLCLSPVLMDFKYEGAFSLEAYERVMLDCMQGDQMLFVREDGVFATWELLTPVIERLERTYRPESFPTYPAGSSGPEDAMGLMVRYNRKWRAI